MAEQPNPPSIANPDPSIEVPGALPVVFFGAGAGYVELAAELNAMIADPVTRAELLAGAQVLTDRADKRAEALARTMASALDESDV